MHRQGRSRGRTDTDPWGCNRQIAVDDSHRSQLATLLSSLPAPPDRVETFGTIRLSWGDQLENFHGRDSPTPATIESQVSIRPSHVPTLTIERLPDIHIFRWWLQDASVTTSDRSRPARRQQRQVRAARQPGHPERIDHPNRLSHWYYGVHEKGDWMLSARS